MHNVIMLNNIPMFISSSDVAVETSKQNRPKVALANNKEVNRDGGISVTIIIAVILAITVSYTI